MRQTRFRNELDKLCINHGVNGLLELSKVSGIYYQTLRNRANVDPGGTKMFELKAIVDAVGATNEEVQALVEVLIGRGC